MVQTREEVLETLRAHREELRERFGVVSLRLFGSFARDEGREDSDVDVLVEYKPGQSVGLFELARLKRALAGLLGRNVDLLTARGLREEVRDKVLGEAIDVARRVAAPHQRCSRQSGH